MIILRPLIRRPEVNRSRSGDRYRLPAPGCCQLSVHKHSFSTPAPRVTSYTRQGSPSGGGQRITGTHKVRKRGRERRRRRERERKERRREEEEGVEDEVSEEKEEEEEMDKGE